MNRTPSSFAAVSAVVGIAAAHNHITIDTPSPVLPETRSLIKAGYYPTETAFISSGRLLLNGLPACYSVSSRLLFRPDRRLDFGGDVVLLTRLLHRPANGGDRLEIASVHAGDAGTTWVDWASLASWSGLFGDGAERRGVAFRSVVSRLRPEITKTTIRPDFGVQRVFTMSHSSRGIFRKVSDPIRSPSVSGSASRARRTRTRMGSWMMPTLFSLRPLQPARLRGSGNNPLAARRTSTPTDWGGRCGFRDIRAGLQRPALPIRTHVVAGETRSLRPHHR